VFFLFVERCKRLQPKPADASQQTNQVNSPDRMKGGLTQTGPPSAAGGGSAG